jgi:hypothetical protein
MQAPVPMLAYDDRSERTDTQGGGMKAAGWAERLVKVPGGVEMITKMEVISNAGDTPALADCDRRIGDRRDRGPAHRARPVR